MDFNSFRSSNGSDSNNRATSTIRESESAEEALHKYGAMSDAEMMQALFGAVNKEKARGLFNIDNIWAFYEQMSPMLDDASRRKMHDIIEAIGTNNR